MADHDEKVEAAKAAIGDVFGDSSVSQQQTIEALEELAGEIEGYIAAIKSDMERT